MHPSLFFTAIVLMAAPNVALSAIYQCQQPNGLTLFADTPCGRNAQSIDPEATRIGGRLDTGTSVKFWKPPEAKKKVASKKAGCPAGYINSTRLRSMRVDKQVQAGMSRKQVRYILGTPDHHDGPWWVYEHDHQETGRYRIRGGCLDKWR